MKLLYVSLLTLAGSVPALAQKGSPTKTNCEVRTYVADHDIKGTEDIERLLQDAIFERIANQDTDCGTYEGKVTVCENQIEQAGLSARYTFNSQNGGLEVQDTVTGQENSTGWMNEYELTDSGYLPLTVDLVNRRGGLLGNPRMFEISVDCGAAGWNHK